MNLKVITSVTSLLVSNILPTSDAFAKSLEELATKTAATQNKAPEWIKHGAYVYRLATTDEPNSLPRLEEGIGIAYHLFDRTVQQIPLTMGLVGDDHPGRFNWDGLWPYWNRVTFRTGGSWENLHDFMKRVDEKANTKVSFHVNLTDVNIGLIQYPETRAFFDKLVETKSIYRREYNRQTRKRDIDPPYIPQTLDQLLEEKDVKNGLDPIRIVALVNYKNFWDSGMAKEMIDTFFSRLPYAPPVLYIDVLTLEGANFNTGFPDGALGGSKETQLEGVLKISEYLRSKGTEVGTEGDRPFLKDYGTYGWLHCIPGISTDDYSKILGASKKGRAVLQQVFGNTGGFCIAPIGVTPDQLAKVREHYALLTTGKTSPRKMPGLETWHLCDRGQTDDEFNLLPGPNGSGDAFRGDWIDLVNHFYLGGIQELYHIGKGNYRTHVYNKLGVIHLNRFALVNADGEEISIPIVDFFPPDHPRHKQVVQHGSMMLENGISTRIKAPKAGKYTVKVYGRNPGQGPTGLNVYVNGELQAQKLDIQFPSRDLSNQEIVLGEVTLAEGEQTFSVDPGPIYVKWNDGTVALWETPSQGKGFKVTNGDVTFAADYDRMWPDTWSGQKKIYFFSWDGTDRPWKLPEDWASIKTATLYPLTPEGRGKGSSIAIEDRSVNPKLLPQVPYILVPEKS